MFVNKRCFRLSCLLLFIYTQIPSLPYIFTSLSLSVYNPGEWACVCTHTCVNQFKTTDEYYKFSYYLQRNHSGYSHTFLYILYNCLHMSKWGVYLQSLCTQLRFSCKYNKNFLWYGGCFNLGNIFNKENSKLFA